MLARSARILGFPGSSNRLTQYERHLRLEIKREDHGRLTMPKGLRPQAAAGGWGGSQTPCFVGRAVAALAADPHVARKNGGIWTTRALSEEYGFTEYRWYPS